MNEQHINKIYDYKDANGQLLFQVVRFEPKGFSQRRPFDDGFVWGLTDGWYQRNGQANNYYKIKDAPLDKTARPIHDAVWFDTMEPVLYRLPELRQGIDNGETIFICEGEKDADNLAALGFVATTCPMGAGKWRSAYTETLKGCREVVVIADKDDPGRAHAQAVARELYSANINVKVMELPDINETAVKDISDWLTAGGEKQAFAELVIQCPNWEPSQQDSTSVIALEIQELINRFGEPYYLNKDGIVTAINQSFWASLHQSEHIQLFEPDERAFYRYDPQNGLYSVISEDVIKQEIASRLLEVSRQQGLPTLERKRTNSNLNHIVSHLKGISEKKNAFRRDNTIVHLANGVIVFKDNGEADFCSFSPNYCSRNQCPIPFNASAMCERFFNELLYPAVSAENAVLLQKYTGLCLLGNNLIQKFLILDGQPGRGKSTLASIIQKLVGQINVTELRTKHLNERFELFRYLKKNLLVGVDVPGQFLSEKGAYVIKGLVGGDWFDAEQKCGTGNFPFQGNFCILITSNSRLQVRLDGDTGAWKRRLLIIRFEAPEPAKKIPHFENLLIQEEGSGILNWALQGLGMLLKDIQSGGDIQLIETQKKIVDGLLAESDSLRHFLMDNVIQNENADLSTTEIVEAYAEYCPLKGWNPKPITVIHRELESLMLEIFGTSKSNSIKRDNKGAKGFRRVAFKDKDKRPWD
ncbi:MAG: hypothetical protein UV05_C0004G0006 [candidate division CPR1 bacterium GW2011_GWA2_42_17]|uniref:SF3 helicase domain-containing protein n=1 Tax=candidate division CPR1 bacterium GW2011_GWA2_42_17 TaxID=1618341 RepID=A0A0G1BDX0_9BACT|nr:MAG: hypothetical protein UV05_C0004G0006 [candidate division CPR1 bacterium GW2011_GWA2_42_17]